MTLRARVSVVVTCFNQAHFLTEAIDSVLAQTYPAFEVVVVDDGSNDNTEEVAATYPEIRCVRRDNVGLAAARNTGISESRGDYLVFLDADDRLLPTALEAGVRNLGGGPAYAFVAGGHRMIAFDGALLWEHTIGPEDDDMYCALLRRNFIAMHAAVMYQRFVFEAVGRFDPRPRSTEDYDMYLRIARRYPIGWHHEVVAEYRRHGSNMTRDSGRVLKSALLALALQSGEGLNARAAAACRAGRRFLRKYYGAEIASQIDMSLAARDWPRAAAGALTLLRYDPLRLWPTLAR